MMLTAQGVRRRNAIYGHRRRPCGLPVMTKAHVRVDGASFSTCTSKSCEQSYIEGQTPGGVAGQSEQVNLILERK